MDMEKLLGLMGNLIKDIMWMIRNRDRVHLLGAMERNTRVVGCMVNNMEKA